MGRLIFSEVIEALVKEVYGSDIVNKRKITQILQDYGRIYGIVEQESRQMENIVTN